MIGGCRQHGMGSVSSADDCSPGLLGELVFKYDKPVFMCVHCGVFELDRSGRNSDCHWPSQ